MSRADNDIYNYYWRKEMDRHHDKLRNAKPRLTKADMSNPQGEMLFERKISNKLHVRKAKIKQIKQGNVKLRNALVAIDDRRKTTYGNLKFSKDPPKMASLSPFKAWGHSKDMNQTNRDEYYTEANDDMM